MWQRRSGQVQYEYIYDFAILDTLLILSGFSFIESFIGEYYVNAIH